MIITTKAGLKVKLTKTTMQTDGVPKFFGKFDYRFNLKDIKPDTFLRWTKGVYPEGSIRSNFRNNQEAGFKVSEHDGGGLAIGCQVFAPTEAAIILKAARAARAAVRKTKKITKKKGKRTRTK